MINLDQIIQNAPYKNYNELRAKLRTINKTRPTTTLMRDPVYTSPVSNVRARMDPGSHESSRENHYYYGVVLKIIDEVDSQKKIYIDIPCDNDVSHVTDMIHPNDFKPSANPGALEKYNHLQFPKTKNDGISEPIVGALAEILVDKDWPTNFSNNKYIGLAHDKIVYHFNTESATTTTVSPISGGTYDRQAAQALSAIKDAETISATDVMDKTKLTNFLSLKLSLTKNVSRKFNEKKLDTIRKILELNPLFASVIASFIKKCWSKALYVFIDNGLRTYDTQADMFIIGRYTDQPIKYKLITLPGFSAHGLGFSVDLHYFSPTNLQYSNNLKYYKQINEINEKHGFQLFWRGECDKWTFGYDKRQEFTEARRQHFVALGITEKEVPIYYLKRAIRRARLNNVPLKQVIKINEQSMHYALPLIENNSWWEQFYRDMTRNG